MLANTEDLYEEACSTVLGRRGLTYDAPLRERMMGRPVADALRIMIEAHNLSDPMESLMRRVPRSAVRPDGDVAGSDAGSDGTIGSAGRGEVAGGRRDQCACRSMPSSC